MRSGLIIKYDMCIIQCLQSVEVKPLNTDSHPEWVLHDEILLTTASITKYKERTKEQRYCSSIFLTLLLPIQTKWL